MELFTIYRHPLDYPGMFVVRKYTIGPWTVTPDPEPWAIESSLEAARAKIPQGLIRFMRADEDDPVIEETWL